CSFEFRDFLSLVRSPASCETSLIFDTSLSACCKCRVTFRISLEHIAENNLPRAMAAGLIQIWAIDHQFLVWPKVFRIFEESKKFVIFLIILKEVSGQHIMTGGHRALMSLVCQAIRTGLRPCHSVRALKETNHPVNEVISSGDQPVGRLHLRIAAVQPLSELLMDRRGNKIRSLDRKEDAARKNWINEASRVSDHRIVRTIVVFDFVGIVSIDQHRKQHFATL